MAILGTIEILKLQVKEDSLLKALVFLSETNLGEIFLQVKPGKNQVIEIEGKQLFAIFQEYDTKTPENIKIEGHRKYIDIQYIFEGKERILLSSRNEISMQDNYNEEKDIYFPVVKSTWSIDLQENIAAILKPEDLHGPCCYIDNPAHVRKIVIKVQV